MLRLVLSTVIAILLGATAVSATESYEGCWRHEEEGDCGTITTSVNVERYGNVFVGLVVEGCDRGRLWESKLVGTLKGDKLFVRICPAYDEETDNDKDINECLTGAPDNYFLLKDDRLRWFKKSDAQWKRYLVLKHGRRAKMASPDNNQAR